MPRMASGARASSDYVRVSSTLETDIPFPELYGVPLEQYMTETQRIFSAVFPDTHRAQRLSPEVWRIFMLPINFFFLSVRPVVDMRVWVHDPSVDGPRPGATATGGKPRKMVCLEAIRCDLRGLDYVLKPDDFILGANGALYPERTGPSARLRGSMHVSVSLAVPPALFFTPRGLLEPAGSAVMEQLLQNMKNKVNSQLLVDYQAYAREEAAKRQQMQSN